MIDKHSLNLQFPMDSYKMEGFDSVYAQLKAMPSQISNNIDLILAKLQDQIEENNRNEKSERLLKQKQKKLQYVKNALSFFNSNVVQEYFKQIQEIYLNEFKHRDHNRNDQHEQHEHQAHPKHTRDSGQSEVILHINQKYQLYEESEMDVFHHYFSNSVFQNKQLADSLLKQAREHEDAHNFGKALQFYQECFLLIKDMLNDEGGFSAAPLHNQIGLMYYHQQNYSKALQCYTLSLDIYERAKGNGCLESANTLHNMGLIYDNQRIYTKALEYYSSSLKIIEKFKGKGCFESANTINNIGMIYCKRRIYAKALKYYNLALGIYQRFKGKRCLQSADTLSNIGNIYGIQFNYNQALKCYKDAQSIYEKFGIKDRGYGNTLFNIGVTYSKLRDWIAAVNPYQSSLKVYKMLNLQEKVKKSALKLVKCLKKLQRFQELQLLTSKYGLEYKI